MTTIAYEIDNKVVTETFVDGIGNVQFPYIVIDDNIPPESIETWYIENDEIKIDQQKLIEFNRKNMPTLSPIEFDLRLDQFELYDAVQNLISTNRSLSIAYNRATFFSRTDPFIESAIIALGLTDEQVDSMWKDTSTT